MITFLIVTVVFIILLAIIYKFFYKKEYKKPVASNLEGLGKDLVLEKRKSLIYVTKKIALSPNIDFDLKEKVYILIDDIWNVIENLNVKYPSQSLTFRINRIASSHLKELIHNFNSLDNPSENDINKLKEQIAIMQEGVTLAVNALQSDEQANFDSTTAFLENMHGKN